MNTSNKTDFWTVLRQTRSTGLAAIANGDGDASSDINNRNDGKEKNARFIKTTKELITTSRTNNTKYK